MVEQETQDKNIREEEKIIRDRKKKIIRFFKKRNLWVVGILIIALILGIYIRSLPMQDHGGKPGLWDITKDTWALGPDLDPYLFVRYARTIVERGSMPEIDKMRYVPVGFLSARDTLLLPYMIAGTYWLFNTIPLGVEDPNIWFAGAIFPVIMFALTILVFFLFVREIFIRKSRKSKTRANIIALISTFFMIVIPVFLSRTVAGIPEKESAGFFFMFLAFYLFVKAWKSENIKTSAILALLAGISTAMMGLIWGGVVFIFITIALANLIAFILNKVDKKGFLIYSLWMISSFLIIDLFSGEVSLKGLIFSTDTGIVFSGFLLLAIHFILWETKLSKTKFLSNIKMPKNIFSLIVAFAIILVGILLLAGPGFVLEKLKALHQTFFKPVTGRWNTTVAENRQPYFKEWASNFGPFLKNIPVLFWLFFIGSISLFKKMLNKLKKKDSWILTGLYTLFLFGLIFSRYSGSSIFNGINFISKAFYYLSIAILLGGLVYYYKEYHKKKDNSFKKINFEYLFLFSLLFLALFSARGAVRLIMVLGPIAPIFLAYLNVEMFDKFRFSKDHTWKIVSGALVILIVLLSLFTFWTFYKQVKNQAYNFVPSVYNQQWQKAMAWTRENTSENAVFGHWWDYGYWVQSIGERATVLDGGNSITYWNYLMGRHVLTGNNQSDALEFLYNHNTTHFLIDSTDIGKYGAFSSIGSNENFDRYSWIPAMKSDEKYTQETRNGTIRVYRGGAGLDEDIVYEKQGEKILLPSNQAAIIGIKIEFSQEENSLSFNQPEGIFYHQGVQHTLPLRYLYYKGQFHDFGSGVKATPYILEEVKQQGGGVQIDKMGALMYISPRVMRGFLAQKYIFNDPFNNFPNFEIAHIEENLFVENLNSQGLDLEEFVFYREIQGPIKIWEINYTGKEEIKQEYLDTNYRDYLDWEL